MKTLEKYISGMDPQIFSFYLDSLHSLACFWACEYDLWRRHPKSQIASFVFQYLHSQRDNVFSTTITRSIMHHLSKDVPKNENYVFSSKYLRIASVTKMATHRGVNFFERHDRSGLSLGTNQERCLEQNILAPTLPYVYALNGWEDETPNKLYLTFHCLGPHVTEQANFPIK